MAHTAISPFPMLQAVPPTGGENDVGSRKEGRSPLLPCGTLAGPLAQLMGLKLASKQGSRARGISKGLPWASGGWQGYKENILALFCCFAHGAWSAHHNDEFHAKAEPSLSLINLLCITSN